MDVLDQSSLQRSLLVGVHHDDRDLGQARPDGGAQSPFPCDQLVAVVDDAHEQRL